MREIEVAAASARYKIFIAERTVQLLRDMLARGRYSRKSLLITDANVGALYGRQTRELLEKAGYDVRYVAVTAGEQAKSLAAAQELFTAAIEHGLDRRSLIVALGGGVVGDLAGFVAATYLRGVPFIQIPTSLLAQVDSSVGGKVAVNHPLGKNMIGAFYQPQAVLIDLSLLASLPRREISTGLAEIIKYGVIYDRELLDYLSANRDAILRLDAETLKHIIARSCEIKAAVVGQDECETGIRIILNFGHTIGHSIEKTAGFGVYNHGEAVAIGMYGAALLSHYRGYIEAAAVEAVKTMLTGFGLPVYARDCPADEVYQALYHDKKVVDGTIKWVLIDRLGNAIVDKTVPVEMVRRVLDEVLK